MTSGGLLVVGLAGTWPTPAERRIASLLRPAGFVLFARNLEEVGQAAALATELRRLVPGALVAVDAEGGRVDRLRAVVAPAPAASALARSAPRLSWSAGRWIGAALRLCGCDLDFAPVVDLDRGWCDNALDDRCLGATPRGVIARGRAFLGGLGRAGVAGCLKHFPGLGGATADTHHRPAAIGLGATALARDLVPFRELGGLAGAVMVGHATYPGLDPVGLPASLSPALATGLLRTDAGFPGLALSDDLQMEALAPHGDLAERAASALVAGCDGLLICRDLESARGVAERLDRADLDRRREEAAARWDRFRGHAAALRGSAAPTPPLGAIRAALGRLAERVAPV